MEAHFDDAFFIEDPSLIFWLDTSSYVGTTSFVNKAKPTESIVFNAIPLIDAGENSFVFTSSQYGTYSPGTNLVNEYTILALVPYINPVKAENDILGSVPSTYNFLMSSYSGRIGNVQWDGNATALVLDSNNPVPYAFAGQRLTSTGVFSSIEDGKIMKTRTGVPVVLSNKVIRIGARFPGYANGFFDGRIKCVKIFNRALTDAEVYTEYQRMIIRYN